MLWIQFYKRFTSIWYANFWYYQALKEIKLFWQCFILMFDRSAFKLNQKLDLEKLHFLLEHSTVQEKLFPRRWNLQSSALSY
jgi:hypothetical protein